jgi:multidrug efflux pump subunit AcrB
MSPNPVPPAEGTQPPYTEVRPEEAKEAAWIVRVSIFNPYAVIVMGLFIGVVGYVCLERIPVDLLPAYKTPAVQVLTLYPGMPADIVERDMTNRLERWTSQAEGVARQDSRSMIGVSILKDYFRDDVDPNTAMSQVAALAISDMYYLPPGTIPPMVMPFDPTASLPTALLAASSDTLNEKEVYDLAYFQVRNMLSGTPGVIAPAVFGGKLRRIYAYLDRRKLQNHHLALTDVHRAIKESNLMIPTGDANIGGLDYQIDLESMLGTVEEFNHIPIKWEGGQPVLLKDVGEVKDTSAIQTNVVLISKPSADTKASWKAKRQVYIPVYRRPGANTIAVSKGIKDSIPDFKKRLGGKGSEELNLEVVADQSVYVKENINSLLWEAALGGVLASLMILMFLGSVRSTVVIVLTIPLSALVAVVGLYFTGNTLNAMTLGGLALVMGRLVDDAIVDVENTFRHLEMGKPPKRAALDSAMEIAIPVLVSTVTTVAVFFPVVFLYGMGKYLFTPLALSVAFAMFASYLLSRTVSPAYCAYFLRADIDPAKRFVLFRLFDRAYAWYKERFARTLRVALHYRYLVVLVSLALFVASFLLYPLIGKELFPQIDAGQFVIGVRTPSGTRMDKTLEIIAGVEEFRLTEKSLNDLTADGVPKTVLAKLGPLVEQTSATEGVFLKALGKVLPAEQVEKYKRTLVGHASRRRGGVETIIKRVIPEKDRQMIVTNIGVLYDWPAGYTPNAGPMDATMLVQLAPQHKRETSAQQYADRLRRVLAEEVPGVEFSFDTGGLVSSALNFGLPAPINLQIEGKDQNEQYKVAQEFKDLVSQVPGAVDVHIQELTNYPKLVIKADRVKMAKLGVTQKNLVENLMSVLNSSTSFDPAFWLDYKTGNHYFVGVTYREEDIHAISTLENVPLTGAGTKKPLVLKDVAEIKTGSAAVEVAHLNLTRVVNLYANVSGRDVGSVAADIQQRLSAWSKPVTSATSNLPAWSVPDHKHPGKTLAGYTVRMRGEVASMQESFASLGFGLVLAAVLIYLLMVAQFRSFLDPFIIMFAVPLGIIGVLVILYLTGTTVNVQSFMGVIFTVGIDVSNSVLLVEFANRLRRERGLNAYDAALESAVVRLRPILMTSLAAIIGLLPMALTSGEANTPLARAVIGGLAASTLLTRFVVPCLYVMVKRDHAAPAAVVS